MTTKKETTQWNIINIPKELDKEVRLYLLKNEMKLYELVIKSIRESIQDNNK